MISLDPEPNPFQSLRNSLAMDNNNSNRATEEDEDDNNSYQPSWAHTPPQIDEQSATPSTSSTTTRTKNPYQKSSLQVRWLILALTCIVMTGSYYAYDIPSALHQQLQDYMSPSTTDDDSNSYETNFNLLYTIYSVPNVILPLFGGNIVDRYGAPKCLTFFATLVFMGGCYQLVYQINHGI